MNDQPLQHILRTGDGESLKLGAPMAGDVRITVDPQRAGSLFTSACQTFSPGASWPSHRYLSFDRVLFVHRGQARVTVHGQSMTVVPGTTISVPRETWFALRNTGTGILEVAWTCAPAGIEVFFRELAQQTAPADVAALHALGQRFGIEFRVDSGNDEPAAAVVHRRRRRRGGREHRHEPHGRSPAPSAPPEAIPAGGDSDEADEPMSMPSIESTATAPSGAPGTRSRTPQDASGPQRGRRRGHRRGRRSGRAPSSATPAATPAATEQPAPTTTPPTAATPQARPAGGRPPRGAAPPRGRSGGQQRRRPHGRRRVREVYMSGQWITVSGDGPAVFPDKESRAPKKKGDDDEPTGPLSVIL